VDILKQADLKPLLAISGERCLTLYMPTHRAGQDQQQNPIRFKNMLVEAEQRLVESGLRKPEARQFLKPADDLLHDSIFWQHQSDGLAVFLSESFSLAYRLPSRFKEIIVLGNTFHIKPLLPLLSGDGKFYLLTVSRNEIRLFMGTRETISEVPLKNVPRDFDTALRMDEPERYENFHTSTRTPGGAGGERPATFHGQNLQDQEKTNLLRYFQLVNQGLVKLLEDQSTPMVLAGVEFLHPIYHQANTYQSLLDRGVSGNAEEADLRDLHKQAWAIVAPIFKSEHREAVERFMQFEGEQNGMATSDLKAGVKAAEVGRIATLFVPLEVEQWGRYEPDTHRVVLDSGPMPENEDLFDLAARQTLLNSGRVYAVPVEELPGSGDLAAILRYAEPAHP
jgi:hypothetical protein